MTKTKNPSAPTPPSDQSERYAAHLHLPVKRLIPAPWHNRSDLNLTPEFLADIQANGVRQNLLVRLAEKDRYTAVPGRQNGEDGWCVESHIAGVTEHLGFYATEEEALDHVPVYEIVAGIRRWTAASRVGLAEVPVRVEPMTDAQAREARLTENLQREGLSPLDEAQQYQDALAGGDYGTGAKAVKALAAKVGRSRSHLYAKLRLLQLSEHLRDALIRGDIEPSVAELIATIPDPAQQAKALKQILDGGHTVYDADLDTEEDTARPYMKERMGVRAVKALLDREYRLDLAKDARWDLADAELLPAAGPCSTCPKRSGTDPDAYPGVKNPNRCFDAGCFAAKRAAVAERLLAPYRAKGKRVLTPQENAKAFNDWGRVGNGWTDGGTHENFKKGWMSYAKALGKLLPEPAYAVNPSTGEVEKLYAVKELQAIARDNGLLETPEDRNRADDALPEAPEVTAARALDRQVQQLADDRMVTQLLEFPDLLTAAKSAKPVLLWLLGLLDRIDLVNHEVIGRRRGWTREGGHLLDHAEKLDHRQLFALLLECFLINDSYADTYEEHTVLALAKAAGVKLDRKAIEKTIRQELTAAADKAKEPAPENTEPEAKGGKGKKTKAAKATKATKPTKAKSKVASKAKK